MSDETLNVELLKELDGLEGDEGRPLVVELAELYLRTTPERLVAISQSFHGGDLASIGRIAHSLKSSSGNLGLVGVQTICMKLERAATAGDAGLLAKLLPELESQYAQGSVALSNYAKEIDERRVA